MSEKIIKHGERNNPYKFFSVRKIPYCGDHLMPINSRSCEVKLDNYITKIKYQLAMVIQ